MRRTLLPLLAFGAFLSHAAADPDEKSLRYHTLLLAKPENPALAARFIDNWLESSDQAALMAFLKQKAEGGTAADWRVLAAVHAFAGNDNAALAALDQAVKLDPEAGAARLARGKILAKMLRIEPALADLEAASADPALDLEATSLSGRMLAQSGRPEEALKKWDGLIAKHPDDPGLREDIIDLLLQENLTIQAADSARKLVELTKDPYQKALRRLRVADILALANKPADAAAEYQAVLALSAQDSWLEKESLALAEKLFSSGQNSTGYRKFLEEAIAAAPARTAPRLALAAQQAAAGDTAAAISTHRELLKASPDSIPIRQSLAALLQQSGQTGEAVAELRLLAERNPADPALWQQLAELCQGAGDQAGLDQAIAKAIALLPNDSAGQIQAAQLHERFQQADRAIAILEPLAKKDGPHSDAADALAQSYARNKKPEKAVALWMEAAKGAPREELLRVSRSLAANGKTSEAYQVLANRAKDFSQDPLVLSALCQAAVPTDEAASAIPHALALLDLATTPTDTQTAVQLALALIRRGSAEEATIRDLTKSPNPTVQRLCLVAQLYESLGDTLSATKALSAAFANDPGQVARLQQIALLEARGDLAGAIATLRDLIAQPGNRTPAQLQRLATLQSRAGLLDDAIATAKEWKTVAPGDKSAYLTMAGLLNDQTKFAEAATETRRAVAKFGNDSELREKLANFLIAAGSQAEAYRIILQLYDEAETTAAKLRLVPTLGFAANSCGREQELEELFRKRIRENPSATGPILALRELLIAWNRAEETYPLLEQAARTATDDDQLQIQLADATEGLGDLEKTEDLLTQLARVRPTPDALRRLSAFYLRTGDTGKADAIIRRLAIETNDPRELEDLVFVAYQSVDWDSALAIIAAAKPEIASDWRIAYLKASALEQLDRTDEAFPIFLSLLSETKELKLPAAPNNVGNYGGYPPYPYLSYGNNPNTPLDPDAQAIVDLNKAVATAYPMQDHGQGVRFINRAVLARYGYSSSYRSSRSSSSGPINRFTCIPASSRELRFRSLVHCFAISCRKPIPERTVCLDRVILPEIPFLAALKRIAVLPETETVDTLLAAKPSNPMLVDAANFDRLQMLVANIPPDGMEDPRRRFSQQRPRDTRLSVKPETYWAAAQALAATQPGRAIDCLVRSSQPQSAGGGKNDKPEEDKLVVEICRTAPREVIVRYAPYLLHRSFGSGEGAENDEVAKEIETLLTAKLPDDNPTLKQLKSVREFRGINEAVTAGRYTDAAVLVNRTFANQKANATKRSPHTSALSTAYGRSSTDANLSPVPRQSIAMEMGYQGILASARYYGCRFLNSFDTDINYSNRQKASIPPEVDSLLKEFTDFTDTSKAGKKPGKPAAIPQLEIRDKPAFLAAVATLEDPMLRLIILDALNYQPEVRSTITDVTKPGTSPSAAVLLWASSWLASRSAADVPAAYSLAVRASAIADPQWAATALNQVVATAILTDEKSRATMDLDPARSALLRLSKSILDPSARQGIAKHMTALGLRAEAVAMTKPAIASRSAGNYAAYSRQTPKDPAALVRNGNRAAAASAILRQLAASTDEYTSRRLIANLKQLKLGPDIAKLHPPASASFEKRAAFAAMLCKVDKPGGHREELERLNRENPDSAQILGLLCLASEPAKQLELLKTIACHPDSDLFDFGMQLIGTERSQVANSEAFGELLDRWRTVITLLDAIPGEQSPMKNLTWINSGLLALTGTIELQDGNIQLRGISEPPPPAPAAGADAKQIAKAQELSKLTEARRDLLHDLATAMLKHPGTADQGFQVLYAGRSAFGLDDAALARHAMTAMASLLSTFRDNGNPASQLDIPRYLAPWATVSPGRGSYSYGSSLPGGTDPGAFLAKLPAASRPADMAATLIATMPAEAGNPIRDCLKTLAAPTPDGVGKIVTALRDPKLGTQSSNTLQTAFALAALDHTDTSAVCDLLFEAIGTDPLVGQQDPYFDPSSGQSVSSPMPLIARFVAERWLTSVPLPDRWKRIERFASSILGPEKFWPIYSVVTEISRNGGYSPGIQTACQRLGILTEILTAGRYTDGPSSLLGNRFLTSLGASSDTNRISPSLRERFPAAYNENKLPDVDALAAEIVDYLRATGMFVPGPGMFSQNALFLPSVIIANLREDLRPAVVKALSRIAGPERFWASFTAAVLVKGEPGAVASLVQGEMPAIRRWPQSQQTLLADFLASNWPDTKSGRLAAWISSATRGLDKDLEDKLTEALVASAVSNGSERTILPLTLRLIQRSPERAAACWIKAGALAEAQGGSMSSALSDLPSLIYNSGDGKQISLADTLRFIIAMNANGQHKGDVPQIVKTGGDWLGLGWSFGG